jgi:hypothetical protein
MVVVVVVEVAFADAAVGTEPDPAGLENERARVAELAWRIHHCHHYRSL